MTLSQGCRGWLVEEIQAGLNRSKLITVALKKDGDFGPKTAAAVSTWQAGTGLAATGEVGNATFEGITGNSYPSLFELCAQITSAFEGCRFDSVIQDPQGGKLGFGFLTFSLQWDHIRSILRIATQDNSLISISSPVSQDEFMRLIHPETPAKEFENAVLENSVILSAWVKFLKEMAHFTHVAQLTHAYTHFWEGKTVGDHTKMIELGVENSARLWAMIFDHAVQSGGLSDKEIHDFTQMRSTTKLPELVCLAHAMANGANPKWREDVLSRRMVFAMGSGTVHGENYLTAAWGLDRLEIGYGASIDLNTKKDSQTVAEKTMESGESMFQSKSIWAGVVAVVSSALVILGVVDAPIGLDNVDPSQQALVSAIAQLVAWAVGLLGAQGIFQRLGLAKVQKKLSEIKSE